MKRSRSFPVAFLLLLVCLAGLLCAPVGKCYPPYQAFVEKHSGRTVNCSLCHVNDNGPIGNGPVS